MPVRSRPKVLVSMRELDILLEASELEEDLALPTTASYKPICKEAEAVSLTEYCRGRGYLPSQSLSERGSYSSLCRQRSKLRPESEQLPKDPC